MIKMTLSEITISARGHLYGCTDENVYTSAVIHLDRIQKGSIFVSIKSDYFNGNEIILDAFNKGATLCIVSELLFDKSQIPNGCSVILVEDTVLSLGYIAKYYIEKLNIPVIAITGSVGKTSTRDMVAATLESKYKVLKTSENWNSRIGLPLTILEITEEHEIAVVEMGMRHRKSIEYLTNIANPLIGVITNIGIAHIDTIGSKEGILDTKMEITHKFRESNILIINEDDALLSKIPDSIFQIKRVSSLKKGSYPIFNIELNDTSSQFNVLINNEVFKISLPFVGEHNIMNALLAIEVALTLNVPIANIVKSLRNVNMTSMRMEVLTTKGYTIISDCYNASPESMKSSLKALALFESDRKIAVLGDMYELGEFDIQAHREVAIEALKLNINSVFTTGKYKDVYKEVLQDKCYCFDSKESLIGYLNTFKRNGDSILIKASRGASFEDIVVSLLSN